MSDAIEDMQKRFAARGMTHMLIQPWDSAEINRRCAAIDANDAENETRLQIAEGRREDKRTKKREKRERRAARSADVCLIVQDQRRGDDRRGKRRI